jgi:hypothetical protein
MKGQVKTPITGADLLNDRVVPLVDAHELRLLRVLTERGTEYYGNPGGHEYELYLAVEDLDHSRDLRPRVCRPFASRGALL